MTRAAAGRLYCILLAAMRRALAAIFLSTVVFAEVPALPPLREQARIQQEWLRLRLERNLPVLMRKHGAQMWIVACREYAEDPAFFRWFRRPCLPVVVHRAIRATNQSPHSPSHKIRD